MINFDHESQVLAPVERGTMRRRGGGCGVRGEEEAEKVSQLGECEGDGGEERAEKKDEVWRPAGLAQS